MLASTGFLCARTIVGNNAIFAIPAIAQAIKTCADPGGGASLGLPVTESACEGKAAIGSASRFEFPVWKTINIGTYRNVNAVRQAFNATPHPIRVDDWANEILGRTSFRHSDTMLDLIVTNVSALGFDADGAPLKDIYARAEQLGLALCPPEVGPILRLDYLDQPADEYLRIAMNSIARYSGDPVDFTVGNDGARLLLLGGDAHSDIIALEGISFVFVRPVNGKRQSRVPFKTLEKLQTSLSLLADF
jgi:hypothetical protein